MKVFDFLSTSPTVKAVGISIPLLKTAISGFSQLLETLFSKQDGVKDKIDPSKPDISKQEEQDLAKKEVKDKNPEKSDEAYPLEAPIDGEKKTEEKQADSQSSLNGTSQATKGEQGNGQGTTEQSQLLNTNLFTERGRSADNGEFEQVVQTRTATTQLAGLFEDLGGSDDNKTTGSKLNITLTSPVALKVQNVSSDNGSSSNNSNSNIVSPLKNGVLKLGLLAQKQKSGDNQGNGSIMRERIANFMKMQKKFNNSSRLSLVAEGEGGKNIKINLDVNRFRGARVAFFADKNMSDMLSSNQTTLHAMFERNGLNLTQFNVSDHGAQFGKSNGNKKSNNKPGAVAAVADQDIGSGQVRSRSLSELVDVLV